jgi:hypothetical protein
LKRVNKPLWRHHLHLFLSFSLSLAVMRYPHDGEALIVVYDLDGETKDIFNGYYRPEKKLRGQYKN